jgi:hypothetical protein
VDGGPEAEFFAEVLAGVDPVGGEAPACAADGLGPRSGGVGQLRTGDEDGLWGFHPHAPHEGGVGGASPPLTTRRGLRGRSGTGRGAVWGWGACAPHAPMRGGEIGPAGNLAGMRGPKCTYF